MERKKVKVDDEEKMELCRKEMNGSVYPTGGKNGKEKRMLVKRKDKREWMGSYERNAIKVREGKERKTAGRDARKGKKGKGGTFG